MLMTIVFSVLKKKNLYELIDKLNVEKGLINSSVVANQLIINENKTKIMVFYRRNTIVSIVLPRIYIKNTSIHTG